MTPSRENIRFNALRNALYHTARRRALERANRIFNFVVVLLGAAAFGDVVAIFGIEQIWFGAIIAVVATLQLVFDFGRQARDHQALQRDYYALLAEIEECVEPTPAQLATWYGRMIRITADEPPTLRALDAKAYNDALDAIDDGQPGERLVVPWLHRRLGGLLPFEGYSYKKVAEIERG